MAPPIYVKGGVWTNVEDQILKAAVSKYGLTQWARVASLLPKKTAKQAKARWNEYLNPSICNNEWEKHDDAKLLDLAKLLPNQWRSVAQIMGRTATQCVERYQKLLDAAVNNGASDDDEHAENVDLTGPGIEALPALGNAFESLPSRPDAEDMDEDEREMLSEAKARLANTQGKKAKRKDRERLLDESRRIALLQKRRELKAAGINVSLTSKNKARRKEFDYNADIPHERIPLPGKYDVSAEEVSNVESHLAFQKQVSVKGLGEGVPKKEKEKEKVSRTSIKSAAGLVTSLDEHQNKRRKLHLPLPGAADEASEIDSHILQVSRELSQKEPVPVAGDVQLQPKKPVSRKKVVAQLKKLLSQMPEPTQQRSVPLQTGLTVQSEPIANNNSNTNALELLRQVDEQATQSQVMQQGLPIPSPDTFDVKEQDSITLQILHEARLLIKSDYDQQVSSLPSRVQPLDSKVWEKAEAMVEEEIEKKQSSQEKRKPLHEKVQELVESQKLPESPQSIDTIYQILNDLNASAHDSDTQISRSSALMDNAQTFASVCQKIQRNSEQLHNYTSELNVTKSIAQDEEITIQTRSAMLSDLVDSVRAAESRVKTGVYSK